MGTEDEKEGFESNNGRKYNYKLDHLEKRSERSPEDFGYLAVPNMDLEWPAPESSKDRMVRKIKENPFVPGGLAVTAFALVCGVFNMRKGDPVLSQRYMRLRIGAQGFTVVTLLIGVYYSARESRLKRQARKLEREAAMAAVNAATE